MNRFRDKKILLIDDEVLITQMCGKVLERAGYREIRCAYTGQEGLEIARQWKPALIISDLLHPGPDGFEIFKELCLAPPTLSTRFIIASAGVITNAEFFEKMETSMVSVFLPKPFSNKQLVAAVDKVFREVEKEKQKGL